MKYSAAPTIEERQFFSICAKREVSILELCNFTEIVLHDPSLSSLTDLRTCILDLEKETHRFCDTEIYGDEICIDRSTMYYCKATGLIRNGVYYFQILEWLDEFSDDEMLIIKSEDFYDDSVGIMEQVSEFLKLQPFEWDEFVNQTFNIVQQHSASAANHEFVESSSKGNMGVGIINSSFTSSYPPIDDETKAFLDDFYRPFTKKLQEILPFLTTWGSS